MRPRLRFICDIKDCPKTHYSKGLCKFHYCQQWKRQYPKRHSHLNRQDQKRHPARCKAQSALRRARERSATPSWVDLAALRLIYEKCPPGYHVDHIYPLASELLCGLHVPWNLQYLSKSDNHRKYNKVPDEISFRE